MDKSEIKQMFQKEGLNVQQVMFRSGDVRCAGGRVKGSHGVKCFRKNKWKISAVQLFTYKPDLR
jgi:D-alanine-D-alanine ligase-like ATP-grasp enzyme